MDCMYMVNLGDAGYDTPEFVWESYIFHAVQHPNYSRGPFIIVYNPLSSPTTSCPRREEPPNFTQPFSTRLVFFKKHPSVLFVSLYTHDPN